MPMNLLFFTTLIIVSIVIRHSVVSEKPAEANDFRFQTNLEEALKYGLVNVLEKENKMGPIENKGKTVSIDSENNKEMKPIDTIENCTEDPNEWVTVENFESDNIRKIELEFAYKEDFIIASYGSIAFRALREKWAINESLMKSLNSGPLIGQCSAGNSGCGFYHTQDGQFMLKSILGEEEEFFQYNSQAFRHYYSYMMEKSNAEGEQSSLLVKYLGFFRFIILPKNQLRENFNLPFVVMPNIFTPNFPIDWKFDLKGTLDESRRSLPRNPMIKDLEFVGSEKMNVKGLFKAGIDFYSNDYEWLLEVLDNDLKALANMGRYDYSLILSIHIINHGENVQNFLDRKKGILRAYCKFCTLPAGVDTDKIPARTQLQHTEGKKLLVGIGIVDTLKPYSTLKSAIAKIHKEIQGKPRVVASPVKYAERFFKILEEKYFSLKKTVKSKSTNKKKGTANGFPSRKGSKRIANGFVPNSAGVKVRS